VTPLELLDAAPAVQALRVVCVYGHEGCLGVGFERVLHEGAPGALTSHGCCIPCRDVEMAPLRAQKDARGTGPRANGLEGQHQGTQGLDSQTRQRTAPGAVDSRSRLSVCSSCNLAFYASTNVLAELYECRSCKAPLCGRCASWGECPACVRGRVAEGDRA
jgi:hypothetical protein